MTVKALQDNLSSIVAALIVVLVCPSFVYRDFNNQLSSLLTYLNGGVIGLTAIIQEPLVLTLNPLTALVGILFLSKKRRSL